MRALSWVLRDRHVLDKCIATLEKALMEDRLHRVRLELYFPKKSTPQNNTVHLWFGEIAELTGHSFDEIKNVCKDQFGVREEVVIAGVYQVRLKSLGDYDKMEMMDFMTRVYAWAVGEMGWDITEPDPLYNT